jgi:hypothetical protein
MPLPTRRNSFFCTQPRSNLAASGVVPPNAPIPTFASKSNYFLRVLCESGAEFHWNWLHMATTEIPKYWRYKCERHMNLQPD